MKEVFFAICSSFGALLFLLLLFTGISQIISGLADKNKDYEN